MLPDTGSGDASQADGPPAKKNNRLGSRKVRTGCITCKLRRVKCDETHPSCRRCTSTGRKCDGYRAQQQGSTQALKSRTTSSLLAERPLSQLVGMQDNEKRAFDFFLAKTAPSLAGTLDKEFWCNQVMQLSHAEPLVLDAVMAISILYEHPQYLPSFSLKGPGELQKFSAPTTLPVPDTNHARALRLYNRAIRGFKQRMEEGKATPLLALLSCVLFICIEIIRDDVMAAFDLFTKGTKILQTMQSTPEMDPGILQTVQSTFARIGVLSAVFGSPPPPEIFSAGRKFVGPTAFSSMTDARLALYTLMGDTHHILHKTARCTSWLFSDGDDPSALAPKMQMTPTQQDWPGDVESSDGSIFSTSASFLASYQPWAADALSDLHLKYHGQSKGTDEELHEIETLLASLSLRQEVLNSRLNDWYTNFTALPKCSLEDERTASGLLMYYHVTFLWLASRKSIRQCAFDQYPDHFYQIVTHAETHVRAHASGQQPPFVFEMGVLPPLYFVTMKCRIPSLRRRALQAMMNAPKKESLWGATSTLELARRIVEFEEEGMGLPSPVLVGLCDVHIDDSVLPEEDRRTHMIQITRNESLGNRFEVCFRRYVTGTDGIRRKVENIRPIAAEPACIENGVGRLKLEN